MYDSPTISRRTFLQGSSALLGGCLLASPSSTRAATRAATRLDLDFRGGIPPGVTFRRASGASVVDDDARLRQVARDAPRFPTWQGAPLGLLIEGEASNLIAFASRPNQRGWVTSGGVSLATVSTPSPDGSTGVFRIQRPAPQRGSVCEAVVGVPKGDEFATASVWLRTPAGSGLWRLRLLDFTSYNNTHALIPVGPEWRRYSLTLYLQPRDTGYKRFAVIWNEPFGTAPASPIYALDPAHPYGSTRTPLTLNQVLMWGAQFERGREASSFIATAGAAASRAADVVTMPAAPLQAPSGRLTVILPFGGRRGGVILDANGNSNGNANGLRLEYSNSGWIVARVGQLLLSGYADVSDDAVVRLEWNESGAQVFTGNSFTSLVLQAAVQGEAPRLDCGPVARLGMTLDGRQSLDRVLAQLILDDEVAEIGRAAPPNFIPTPYRLTFSDDFDDADVTRINEHARGGKPGAPAWRSRYRHERRTVINQEKQIYMDPQFAGTAGRPLGVQPFSIRDGILQIRAERATAAVSPYIWNYRYTSGCITTELTHWQTYGYFEMRARLPRGKGYWPAFWLLAKRTVWPPEIDVFEASGARPYGIHQGVIEQPTKSGSATGLWIDAVIDGSDGFHIYGVEWTRDNIIFFIDGMKSFEYGPHNIHQDMYLLANLALGSHDANWIPDPDAGTPFPGLFEIDYIRAYQRSAP